MGMTHAHYDTLADLTAHISIVSLAHHGPCLLSDNSESCHPSVKPSLDTGGFDSVTCGHLPDGSCQLNMSLAIQLLGGSTITVDVKPVDGQMVYNGGWWWQIDIAGIENETTVISNVTYRNQLLPPTDTAVFHGPLGTASTVSMTFTRQQGPPILVPEKGDSAEQASFYDRPQSNALIFDLKTSLSNYMDLTQDTMKKELFDVIQALMGSLSGALGGLGLAKSLLQKGLAILARASCKRKGGRRSSDTSPGGPGKVLIPITELSASPAGGSPYHRNPLAQPKPTVV
ncbi:hypothetical protein PAPYR_5817 [Paratrimastix pyriformis]|uniref:Uncharacterized protein n=1 Tax=Paratrimastix pyriformis TaxID=342808 RepID=A0ABQ8UGQ3_9EUKA|nr:hypothetical protein PAPYR_5817 [Paratrimastix pyriformis]